MSETISKYELSKNKLAAEYQLMSIIDKNKASLKMMNKAEAYDFIWEKLGDGTPITVTRIATALRTFGILYTRDKGYGSNKSKVSKEDLISVIRSIREFCDALDDAIGDYETSNGDLLSEKLVYVKHELESTENKLSA